MPLRRGRHAAVLWVVSAVIATTSCSPSGTPSTGGPKSSRTTPTTTASTPQLQGHRVSAPRAGISLDAPGNWTAIDPAVMARASAANLPESVKDLAAQSGVSVEEYIEHMSASTEIVVTGRREHGYVNSVAVIPGPDGPLPTIETVRAGLESAGATVIRIDNTSTPIGPALVAQMRMTVGSSIANQQLIVVKHGNRTATVTAAAREWEAADRLARSVMASLSEQ